MAQFSTAALLSSDGGDGECLPGGAACVRVRARMGQRGTALDVYTPMPCISILLLMFFQVYEWLAVKWLIPFHLVVCCIAHTFSSYTVWFLIAPHCICSFFCFCSAFFFSQRQRACICVIHGKHIPIYIIRRGM